MKFLSRISSVNVTKKSLIENFFFFFFFFFDVVLLNLDGMDLWKLFQIFNSLGFTYEDIEGLNYFERCSILHWNAVVLASHFQYRFEFF